MYQIRVNGGKRERIEKGGKVELVKIIFRLRPQKVQFLARNVRGPGLSGRMPQGGRGVPTDFE